MKVYIVKTVSECEGYLIERINKVFSNKELSLKYAKGLQIEKSITVYDDTEEFIEGDIYIEEYDVEDNEFKYTYQQDLSDEDREDNKTFDSIIHRLEDMIIDLEKYRNSFLARELTLGEMVVLQMKMVSLRVVRCALRGLSGKKGIRKRQ